MQTIIEPGATRSLHNPRGLWRYRELLVLLAWRDVRVRYRQTLIGAGWAVVEPLATALVFTLLFHGLARLDAGYPYALFCYAGALPWMLFSRTLRGAAGSLIANAGLLGKAYFPRVLLPGSATLVSFVDLAFGLLAFVPLALLLGALPGPAILLLPVWALLAAMCGGGLGAGLAVLNARFRDIHHALPLLVQIWMLLTPVAYPLTAVPAAWRWLFLLNPMTGIVEGVRWSLLPGYPLPADALASALAGSALALAGGLLCFHVGERGLADVI